MSTHDDIGLETATVRPAPRPGDDGPRGSWLSERLVLSVWALLTVVAVVVFLVRSEQDSVADPVQKAARGEVTGLAPLSFLRADRFAAALDALWSREPKGRIITLRLDPTRVNAQVRTPDFKVHYLDVNAALAVSEANTSESVQEGIAYATIDPTVPQRMVRAVNAQTDTSPADVDYLTLTASTSSASPSTWALRLARGVRPDRRMYTAKLNGSGLRGAF